MEATLAAVTVAIPAEAMEAGGAVMVVDGAVTVAGVAGMVVVVVAMVADVVDTAVMGAVAGVTTVAVAGAAVTPARRLMLSQRTK